MCMASYTLLISIKFTQLRRRENQNVEENVSEIEREREIERMYAVLIYLKCKLEPALFGIHLCGVCVCVCAYLFWVLFPILNVAMLRIARIVTANAVAILRCRLMCIIFAVSKISKNDDEKFPSLWKTGKFHAL